MSIASLKSPLFETAAGSGMCSFTSSKLKVVCRLQGLRTVCCKLPPTAAAAVYNLPFSFTLPLLITAASAELVLVAERVAVVFCCPSPLCKGLPWPFELDRAPFELKEEPCKLEQVPIELEGLPLLPAPDLDAGLRVVLSPVRLLMTSKLSL